MDRMELESRLTILAKRLYMAEQRGQSIYGVQGDIAECCLKLAEAHGFKRLNQMMKNNPELALRLATEE